MMSITSDGIVRLALDAKLVKPLAFKAGKRFTSGLFSLKSGVR